MRKALCLTLFLAACSGAEPQRYLIAAPVPAEPVRLAVSTVELREVSLPGHASGSDVLVQTADGGLVPLGDAIWADDPASAVTAQLAEAMDAGSSATVAAEPWPLFDRPQAQVEVRISRMLARADGLFDLTGQVAVSGATVRERVDRFAITVPLAEVSAAGISAATGQALNQLADSILGYLAR